MHLFGVDLVTDRVRDAHAATRGINVRVGYAAADACRLPFAADSFDSTYCVAVLQHIRDLSGALGEIARVTRPGGRVLIVEPDNAARYWFSSVQSGMEAFELSRRFFGGLLSVRGESPAAAVGPLIPGLLVATGIEPFLVRLFPVSVAHLGAPPPSFWESRRAAVRAVIAKAPDEALRRLGADFLKVDRSVPRGTRRPPARRSSRFRTRCCSRRSDSARSESACGLAFAKAGRTSPSE